jgi:hypothetical protein
MRQEHYMTPGVLVSDEQAVRQQAVPGMLIAGDTNHPSYAMGWNDCRANLLSAAPAPAKCKCSMAISVLGDGCSVCNPEYLAEMLADQAEDEKEDAIAELVEALENVLKLTRGSSGRIILDQQDEQDLRDALAHRQQEQSHER